MTLEDFKSQFEIFSKIDTLEKLAICERQYKEHLLHIEDEEYFEPIKKYLGADITSSYEKNLNNIFHFNKIKNNQFYFLVKPSFDPESLLILEKKESNYSLTNVTLAKNYWSVFYADNKIIEIEKTTFKSELNKVVGDKLFLLLNKTIVEARQPKANRITLDGVVFKLSRVIGNEQITVSKHSPNEKSKSGKVIFILMQLIDNIKTLDNDELLNSMVADIDDLLN